MYFEKKFDIFISSLNILIYELNHTNSSPQPIFELPHVSYPNDSIYPIYSVHLYLKHKERHMHLLFIGKFHKPSHITLSLIFLQNYEHFHLQKSFFSFFSLSSREIPPTLTSLKKLHSSFKTTQCLNHIF